jgi:hypothetical protein
MNNTPDKHNKKFLKDLGVINKDPQNAVRSLEIRRNAAGLTCCLILLIDFMFYNSLSILPSFILVGVAVFFLTISVTINESAKNIVTLNEVVNWEKVKNLQENQK